MNAREPGQVRKEAAVSEMVHVPKGGLARANDKRYAWITTINISLYYESGYVANGRLCVQEYLP
jgi:hypothetical protein